MGITQSVGDCRRNGYRLSRRRLCGLAGVFGPGPGGSADTRSTPCLVREFSPSPNVLRDLSADHISHVPCAVAQDLRVPDENVVGHQAVHGITGAEYGFSYPYNTVSPLSGKALNTEALSLNIAYRKVFA